MRAIVLEKFGGLDSLVYREIPEPEPKASHVVIQIKAFGINHAEMHMRRGEWAEAAPVSGIECVGLVKSCPGGEFAVGAKVAALMGGLGRTINGSYAEYTRAPASNVALIESNLPWAELAAIPARELLAIARRAAWHFADDDLPLDPLDGSTQSPQQYVEQTSATTGLSYHVPEARYVDDKTSPVRPA